MRSAIVLAAFLVVACQGSPGTSAVTPDASATPTATTGTTSSPGPIPTPTASRSPFATPTPRQSPGYTPPTVGRISGRVSTPSEVIVPQLVYAISTSGAAHGAYSTETVWNQPYYVIESVVPGTYYVFSTRRPVTLAADGKVIGALFSTYVKCGLGAGCSTHTPVAVTVVAGATGSADPIDWYLPDGKVQAPPSSVVPTDPGLITPAAAYDSAREAAVAITRQSEDALLVEGMQACPAGRACVWIGDEHDGTAAAYFLGYGGSSAAPVPCGAFVFKDAEGWHGLHHDCGQEVFPAIGRSGHVFLGLGATGCANFRSAPGAAGKVLGCLPAGTLVKVNMEPVYSKFPGTNGLWWHVYSHGWMADDFLR